GQPSEQGGKKDPDACAHAGSSRRVVDQTAAIAAFGAGCKTFGSPARPKPSCQSLNEIESSRASKDASTIFGETPTVNQRCPVSLSRLSISTRVTASVPPVRMRTL